MLDGFGLLSSIDLMLLSGEIGMEKPDARLFQIAANHFELSNMNQLLHIGDNVKRDYEGAHAAGARALLFSRTSTTDGPSQVPPEMIVHSLAEVAKCL